MKVRLKNTILMQKIFDSGFDILNPDDIVLIIILVIKLI